MSSLYHPVPLSLVFLCLGIWSLKINLLAFVGATWCLRLLLCWVIWSFWFFNGFVLNRGNITILPLCITTGENTSNVRSKSSRSFVHLHLCYQNRNDDRHHRLRFEVAMVAGALHSKDVGPKGMTEAQRLLYLQTGHQENTDCCPTLAFPSIIIMGIVNIWFCCSRKKCMLFPASISKTFMVLPMLSSLCLMLKLPFVR